MMNCKRALARLTEYQQGELSPIAAAQVEAHLASCPRCRETFSLLAEAQREMRLLAATYRCPPVSLSTPILPLAPSPARRWAWAGALTALLALGALGVQQAYRGRQHTMESALVKDSPSPGPPALPAPTTPAAVPTRPAPRVQQEAPTLRPVQPAGPAAQAPAVARPREPGKLRLRVAPPLPQPRTVPAVKSTPAAKSSRPMLRLQAPTVTEGSRDRQDIPQDTVSVPEPALPRTADVQAAETVPAPAKEEWTVASEAQAYQARGPQVASVPHAAGAAEAAGADPGASRLQAKAPPAKRSKPAVGAGLPRLPGDDDTGQPAVPPVPSVRPLGALPAPGLPAPAFTERGPAQGVLVMQVVAAAKGTAWRLTLRVTGRGPGDYSVTTSQPAVSIVPGRGSGEFVATVSAQAPRRVALVVADARGKREAQYWLYLPTSASLQVRDPLAEDALAALAMASGVPVLSPAQGPLLVGDATPERLLRAAGWRLARVVGAINAQPPAAAR